VIAVFPFQLKPLNEAKYEIRINIPFMARIPYALSNKLNAPIMEESIQYSKIPFVLRKIRVPLYVIH
jgi:hypothetical protein